MPEKITIQPLPGYKEVKPFVYAGFFPVSNEDYNDLKEAIEKLSLSDSALQFEPENSPVWAQQLEETLRYAGLHVALHKIVLRL